MKIALDVDDVLAAFTPHAHSLFNKEMGKCDYWCKNTMDKKFGKNWFINHIKLNKEFWLTIPILSKPEDITFEFDYYMSSFPEEMYDERVEWLKVNGFPDKPLMVTDNKLDMCMKLGVNILVDDKPDTIKSLNNSPFFPTKGIHFINEYAGFEPIGDFITNLNQLNRYL